MNDIETSVENTVQDTAPAESIVESNAGSQISEDVDTNKVTSNEAHSEQNASEQTGENRFEKAFAARLAKEKVKLETELSKKYSKHDYVLSKAAAENDMTIDEYLETLEKDYRNKELESIPKDIRDDVLWAREQREKEQSKTREESEKAEAEIKWNNEVKSLLQMFPDVKTSADIPDEVLEMRVKDSVPLEYAYAKYALGKERTKIEQETIKKLRDNEASSPGSMASSSADTKLKVANMDDSEFEKLMDEVRRGTRKSL